MQFNKKTLWGIIKKAYAEAAKEDEVRDKLAYREMSFSWNLEDIDFWFTVKLGQGKVRLSEGESKDSDMIFYNKKAEDFHRANSEEITGRDMLDSGGFRYTGHLKHLRHISVLCRHVRTYYKRLA